MPDKKSIVIGADTSEARQEFRNLIKESRQLTKEVMSLQSEYDNLSKTEKQSLFGKDLKRQLDELYKSAGEAKDQISDVREKINFLASDTKQLDGMLGIFNLLASSVQVSAGVMGLFGVEEEKVAKIQKNLTAIIAVTNGLTQIQNALQKQSATYQTLVLVKTKALTVAQSIYNRVLLANPYIAAAAGITALVGGIVLLTKHLKQNTKEIQSTYTQLEIMKRKLQDTQKVLEDSSKSAGGQIAKYKMLQKVWNELGGDVQKQKQFVTEYAGELKKLDINGLTEAEKAFANDTSFINGIKERAKQMATYNLLVKKYQELLTEQGKEHKIRNWRGGQDLTSKDVDRVKELGGKNGIDYITEVKQGIAASFITTYKLTEEGAKKLREKEKQLTLKTANQLISEINELSSNINVTDTLTKDDKKPTKQKPPKQEEVTQALRFVSFLPEDDYAWMEYIKESSSKGVTALKVLETQLKYANEEMSKETDPKKLTAWAKSTHKLEEAIKRVKDNLDKIGRGEGLLTQEGLFLPDNFDINIDFDQIKEAQEETKELFNQLDEIRKLKLDTLNDGINNLCSSFSNLGQIIGGLGGQMISWVTQSASAIALLLSDNARLLVSYQATAMAGGAKSAFSLPFPANFAAWASTLATITSIFASLPKFSNGGVFDGVSPFGDMNIARVNKGEMLLNGTQQKRLFDILDGNVYNTGNQGKTTLTFRQRGNDLYTSLKVTGKQRRMLGKKLF